MWLVVRDAGKAQRMAQRIALQGVYRQEESQPKLHRSHLHRVRLLTHLAMTKLGTSVGYLVVYIAPQTNFCFV